MINVEDILVIDIETVAAQKSFKDLDEDWQKLWNKKVANLDKTTSQTPEKWYDKAGIYAEFGKIVCIGFGAFYYENDVLKLKVKSLFGKDEKAILVDFANLLNKYYSKEKHILCAHNGKEFDYPYICRRMLVNGIKIPQILDISDKKPWEIQHLDTLEFWKFGDYKNFTSLALLAKLFEIPSPKDDIDGSMVNEVFWQNNDVERISEYCKKDVATTAKLLTKLKFNIDLISTDINII